MLSLLEEAQNQLKSEDFKKKQSLAVSIRCVSDRRCPQLLGWNHCLLWISWSGSNDQSEAVGLGLVLELLGWSETIV